MGKLRDRLPALAVGAVLLAGLGAVAWKLTSPSGAVVPVQVRVPALSPLAEAGRRAFDATCRACHGANGAGSDKGPPLVHDIYNPGHHADAAFARAVRQGVPQHHWSFGNMPPQPKVTDEELTAIVRYVRELQAANGIRYRRHVM